METTVALTELLVDVFYPKCINKQHHHSREDHPCQESITIAEHQFECVLDELEKKKPTDFVFRHYKFDEALPKPTLDDFKDAVKFSYDENTLLWVGKSKKFRSELVELLANAGIVECSNGNEYVNGSRFLTECVGHASDKDICWMIFCLGFKPESSCYAAYGKRKDRTFEEKIKMFEIFRNKCYLRETFLTHWFQFSEDITETKKYIEWLIHNGCPMTSVDFTNSFIFFGTELFGFLKKIGLHPDNIDTILRNNKRTCEEKKEALEWITNNFPGYEFESHSLRTAFEIENFEIFEFLVRHGAVPNWFLLEVMLMHRFESDDKKLSFDFVTKCVDFVLNNSNLKIPHTGPDWYQYQHREAYRFEGKLFDWLAMNQKKMQESLQERKKHENINNKKENDFRKKYGMSEEALEKKQDEAKKNGQCYNYGKRNRNNDCKVWPNCKFYHGRREECYKTTRCPDGEKCKKSPFDCIHYHKLPESMRKEHDALKASYIIGKGNGKECIDLDQEKEIADRLNKFPWLHFVPCQRLDHKKMIDKNYNRYFTLCDARCYGKNETNEGPRLCHTNKVKFMALNEGETWARYYCSLEHLEQVEGSDCTWYMQEPNIY